MEAWSVEDGGEGICFNVYCYNVQPGVKIDYKTGESWIDGEYKEESEEDGNSSQFVLNTSSKKVHKPTCSSATSMSEKNKKTVKDTELQQYLDQGYEYCGSCFED
jgi:DNA-entry nuclease